MTGLGQDLRDAARSLRSSPGFTAVAVIVLGLGIGANTAVFTVADAVVLRPLPFEHQDRLVMLWERDDRRGQPFVEVSYPAFADWRRASRSFEAMAALPATNQRFTWTGGGEPIQIEGRLVTEGFFEVLGARPRLGRTFRPDDDRAGAGRIVVIGHGLWQRLLGSDPQVVGRTLNLNGSAFTVVGVMPPAFQYPKGAELWTPLVPAAPQLVENRKVGWAVVIGRLGRGVGLDTARTEMDGIVRRLADDKLEDAGRSTVLTPLVDELLGDTRLALLVLLGSVGLVLLLACSNVAALHLVRAAARQREFGLRVALGAGRMRIARLLLAESALIALLGSAAGLLLAARGVDALVALGPQDVPRLREATIDGRVFGFTVAVSVFTALASGLLPALRASRPSLSELLADGARSATGGRRMRKLRALLVTGEVAVSVVLLVGAGLLGRSFVNLSRVDLGFDPQGLLTLEVGTSEGRSPSVQKRREFYRSLVARVETLPGVESAAAVLLRPLWGQVGLDWPFAIEGQPPAEAARNPLVNLEAVTPGYFRTMEMRLLAGRDFSERDAEGQPGVVVLSRTMAERCWPGQDAIGKRLRLPLPGTGYDWALLSVAGVVEDARYRELRAARLDVYLSFLQSPYQPRHLMVRAAGDPAALAGPIRREVRSLDPEQPVSDVATMEQLVAAALRGPRFGVQVLGAFACVALALAALGLYGVTAHTVAQRTREIGVRVALGARGRDVLSLILSQGMRPAAAGTLLGLALALALQRVVSGLLFGVGATDAATFAGVATLLAMVSLVALYIPARRAARLDPNLALRHE